METMFKLPIINNEIFVLLFDKWNECYDYINGSLMVNRDDSKPFIYLKKNNSYIMIKDGKIVCNGNTYTINNLFSDKNKYKSGLVEITTDSYTSHIDIKEVNSDFTLYDLLGLDGINYIKINKSIPIFLHRCNKNHYTIHGDVSIVANDDSLKILKDHINYKENYTEYKNGFILPNNLDIKIEKLNSLEYVNFDYGDIAVIDRDQVCKNIGAIQSYKQDYTFIELYEFDENDNYKKTLCIFGENEFDLDKITDEYIKTILYFNRKYSYSICGMSL